MQTLPQIPDRQQTSLLATVLGTLGYHANAIESITAHAAAEGTIDGAPGLEPEDVEAAESALETGYETVAWTSPEWGNPIGQEHRANPRDDIWNPDEPPPVEEEWEANRAEQPEPSAEDLHEYSEWSAELEARQDAEQWYATRASFVDWIQANGGVAWEA
jgi:hypothetical protein